MLFHIPLVATISHTPNTPGNQPCMLHVLLRHLPYPFPSITQALGSLSKNGKVHYYVLKAPQAGVHKRDRERSQQERALVLMGSYPLAAV